MTQDKINLAVFISGNGSNMKAIAKACEDADYPARIALVLSNTPHAKGLEFAQEHGIETAVVNHKDYDSREDFDQALLDTLNGRDIDLICLAGFIRILTPVFVDAWPEKIINTHPSLLPKHGGKGMHGRHVHQAVLDAGDTKSGVSIHTVTQGVDEGPVILQREVPVHSDDTPDTLAARVIAQEHIAYPAAIEIIANQLLKKS